MQELLRNARGLDVELDWCERLNEGIAMTGRHDYDVVLLDLGLPDAEGLETVQAAHAAAPLTPIVVLSGNEDSEIALLSVRHGAQDYLLKGQVDRPRLTRAIRYALERRRADRELRRNEQLLAEVFAQMPEGILLLDSGDRLRFANPPAQEYLLGLTPERVHEGDRVPSIGGIPLDQLVRSAEAARSAGTGHPILLMGEGWGGPRTFEAQVRTVSGTPAGQRLVSLREVTEDEGLRRSLQIQHRVAAVGVIAARISETFNDELEALAQETVELAQRAPIGGDARERVETLQRQLGRSRTIVERIVRFSRDQGGPPRRMDLAESILELGEVLHHLIPEHIDVEVELEPGDYPILASPTEIQQVFTNLAVNARDAMPDGGRLTLALTQLLLAPGDLPPTAGVTAGRWAVASVADTGVGVSEDAISRVFDPFFTTKSGQLATGLGLAQVFGLIRRAGGFVTVRRRVGPGARFMIYLPFAAPVEGDEGVANADASAAATESGGAVLVVGLGGRGRRRLVELLEGLGHQARWSDDPADAIRQYADDSDRIDVVISHADPALPGGPDGVDLAGSLHELDPLVRVVLLTSRAPSARPSWGHPAVYGWLQTPVEVLALQAALAQAMQAGR